MFLTNKRNFNILALGVIVLLGTVIYSNTFHSTFHFDDMYYIVKKAELRDIADINTIWTAYGKVVRFVAVYTFALNYHFNQYHVFGYHLVNHIIHLINALLVYWLVIQTLFTRRFNDWLDADKKYIIAFFSALVFLAHPVQTQSVTYITQRFASLATLFYLLTVCLYIRGRRFEGNNPRAVLFYILTALAAVAGMFTKEITITLPLAVIVYEKCFLTDSAQPRKGVWKFLRLRYILILLFLIIIPAAMKFNVINILKASAPSESHLGDEINSLSYARTQLRVVMTYIRLLFVPFDQNLDYDYPLVPHFYSPVAVLCLLFHLELLIYCVARFKKHPLVSFGVFWFYITLLVESSFIPIRNVIFEHRIYLPSVGFAIVVTALLAQFVRDKRKLIAILGVYVLILSVLTYMRNNFWQNETTLWSDVIKKSPQKARPYISLGIAQYENKLYDQALLNFNRALAISSFEPKAYNNRGLVYTELGQYGLALNDFNQAIQMTPDHAPIYSNRGDVHRKMKEYGLAMVDYNMAISLNVNYAEAYVNRGVLYGEQKDYAKAIADFNEAIRLHPFLHESYNNRAVAFNEQGQFELAMEDLNKALELKPIYPDAYYNRGNAYKGQGKLDLAIADYTKAVELDPQYDEPYNNRGIVYGMLGKNELALQDFDKAIDINPQSSSAYFNRALAYMYLGESQKAMDNLLKAEALGKEIPTSMRLELNKALAPAPDDELKIDGED